MRRSRKAPGRNGERIADLRPEPIDEPAEQQNTDRIGSLKGGVDQAELFIAPSELAVGKLLDQRENLAIDIVDGGGKEEQRADDPTDVGHRGTFRRKACLPVEDYGHLVTADFASRLARSVVSKMNLVAGGAVITS